MYTDDVSDKECENGDKKPKESHHATKKSLSTVGFRNNPENQNARPLALRSTQSFTGAVEELRLSNNLQQLNLNSGNPVSAPNLAATCPCGGFLQPAAIMPFRTRERNTYALHVVPPEVLHYHGYDFEPSQIAMFWKKDCRKFLWKGSKALSADTSNNHDECCHDTNI